jgi:hypothetical protein
MPKLLETLEIEDVSGGQIGFEATVAEVLDENFV